jgi:hypothetical protein
MAIKVTIEKNPLYGSVYWNGLKFIYTPNSGFTGNDYYIYTLTDGASSITNTNYVSTENSAPSASNIDATINANIPNTIDVKDYISDSDNLIDKLRITKLSKPSYGIATFNGTIISYEPLGFSGYDILDYTISDGQYEVSAKITLNITGGRTYEAPPQISENLNNIEVIANTFDTVSGEWDASTTLVSSKSAKWINIDKDKYDDVSTKVENNSANWNAAFSNLGTYDSAYTTVTAQSAKWDTYVSILNNLTAGYQSNSATWYNGYNLLTALSGGWQNNVSDISSLSTSYSANSSFWNSTYLLVSGQSGKWDKTALTNILTANSANWDSGYTLLTSNSATWSDVGLQLASIYLDYNTLSSNWDSVYTVVSTSSAGWNQSTLITIFSTNSASWNNTSNTVTASSGNWDTAYTVSTSISTLLSSNSANWDNAYNIVSGQSANWGGVAIFNALLPVSGNWDLAYTTLTSYSGKWDNVSNVDVVYSILTANSALWNSSYTQITSNSANWNNSYTTVNTNSSKWLNGGNDVNALFNNLTAFGNVVIYGNISAAGSITQQTSENTTASSFSIVNTGFADAFTVKKTESVGALADFNVNDQTVLYVNTNGRVGINTKTPGQALTVVGDISASGSVYATVPSEYTVFSNNSSKYENSYTYLTATSGSIKTLLDNKSKYDSAYTYLTGASAGINNFYPVQQTLYTNIYNAVTAQSAQNYTAYTTVTANSGNIGTDTLFRSKSANYESAYSFITANSAAWIPSNPIFNTVKTGVLTSGPVTLTNALLATFNTPITASEQFLSIVVNNQTRLIQLWNS